MATGTSRSRPMSRGRWARARFPASCSFITRPAGTSGTARPPANSRITAMPRSAITSITAPARANPTTSPPRCAPRAACPTRRSSTTPKARCSGCAPNPGSTARSASSAPAQADGTPFSMPAIPRASTPQQPTAPVAFTQNLSCPLLGLFGNEDRAPSPEQVDQHEAELKKYGKQYEFYRYDGAGHGFFYYDRPMYRVEQALDGWQKLFGFFAKHRAA